MNANALPTQTDDDMDRLLSAYFKRQMPAEWPACRALAVAEPSTLRPRVVDPAAGNPSRSSLTLAASVAALLGLGLVLTSGPRDANAPAPSGDGGVLYSGTADGKKLLDPLKPAPKGPNANP